eukprot:6484493-Amphidinium_carterae.1
MAADLEVTNSSTQKASMKRPRFSDDADDLLRGVLTSHYWRATRDPETQLVKLVEYPLKQHLDKTRIKKHQRLIQDLLDITILPIKKSQWVRVLEQVIAVDTAKFPNYKLKGKWVETMAKRCQTILRHVSQAYSRFKHKKQNPPWLRPFRPYFEVSSLLCMRHHYHPNS